MRILCCLAAIVALGACARTPAPTPEPPVAPSIPPPAPAPPAPLRASSERLGICVLRDGQAVTVPIDYRPETGDTLVNGRPFSEVYPATTPPYAAGADWYVRHEPVTINGRLLAKYGLPLVLYPEEVKRVGEYRGLPVFAEIGAEGPTYGGAVYLMVRTGCEFQPYMNTYVVGEVRGG